MLIIISYVDTHFQQNSFTKEVKFFNADMISVTWAQHFVLV